MSKYVFILIVNNNMCLHLCAAQKEATLLYKWYVSRHSIVVLASILKYYAKTVL